MVVIIRNFLIKYWTVFSILFDIFSIFTIIYIYLHSDSIKLSMNKYDYSNSIDMKYCLLMIVFIIMNNLVIHYYKNTGTIAITIRFILKVLSAGMGLLSFKIYWLSTHYVDSIPLKFNFYLHKVWRYGELKEYLTHVLLNKPEIHQKLKEHESVLPLSELTIVTLLDNCITIRSVNSKVEKFILSLERHKEELLKAELIQKTYADKIAEVASSTKENINTVHHYFVDNNVYWWLGFAVFLFAAGYYYLNGRVTSLENNVSDLANESKTIGKNLIAADGQIKADAKRILDINKQSISTQENVKNLNDDFILSATVDIDIADNVSTLSGVVSTANEGIKQNSDNLSKTIDVVKNLSEKVDTLDKKFNALNSNVSQISNDINNNNELVQRSFNKLSEDISNTSKLGVDNANALGEKLSSAISLSKEHDSQIQILSNITTVHHNYIEKLQQDVTKMNESIINLKTELVPMVAKMLVGGLIGVDPDFTPDVTPDATTDTSQFPDSTPEKPSVPSNIGGSSSSSYGGSSGTKVIKNYGKFSGFSDSK